MSFDPLHIRLVALSACAFGVALLLEPLVIRTARVLNVTDDPEWRKVHRVPTASIGGLPFFPALAVGLAVVLLVWPAFWQERYLGLVGAALVITLAGVWDDVFGMRATVKLACQFAAGAVMYFAGYRLESVGIPFTHSVIDLGVLDFAVTLLAVAAIINAINMLDGLDGLAAGSVAIMCMFLVFNKISQGDGPDAAIAALVIGMTGAFLLFNFHPARVFMGDTGAMFLGLILAGELLDATSQGTAVATILLPLVILGIPIFDMLLIMVTRASATRHIFMADKSHLHHRLLSLGLSHREVVLVVYAMNVYMGVMAIIYKHVAVTFRGWYLFSLALFLFIIFYAIGMAHRSGNDDVPSSGDAHE